MRWKALAEIYKMHSFAPSSKLKRQASALIHASTRGLLDPKERVQAQPLAEPSPEKLSSRTPARLQGSFSAAAVDRTIFKN